MTTLRTSTPSPVTEVVEKKKRQKKVKPSEPILSKAPPLSTDYVIVLIRLEDGRVLAVGDKNSADEQMFKSVGLKINYCKLKTIKRRVF